MLYNQSPFTLIIAGNTNIPAMMNAIIRATIEARANQEDESLTFNQVHIFHTEQSLKALMTTEKPWEQALAYYNISATSLVHHTTKIEDPNDDRFRDLIEQLRTIVNPLDNAYYYIDLTGGITALKTSLAVFAYVLGIEHMYSLEIDFSTEVDVRKKQVSLFYNELEKEAVKIEYRKFPPSQKFDEFGKRNYTEVIRHRQIIATVTEGLAALLPSGTDLEHLRGSLLSGINSRLIGDVTGESYSHRYSIFSSSAGVEETANIIFAVLGISNNDSSGTLGDKMKVVRNIFESNPKYFINKETLEYLTRLMTEIRNDVAHPRPNEAKNRELLAIQSHLSSELALTFLRFTIRTITAFLNGDGKLVDVQILEPQEEHYEEVFYFGFDGDATGDYLEVAFSEANQDETEVLRRSEVVREAIKKMRKIINKETQDHTSVLFAEGDNVLFKAKYRYTLLNELQKVYKEQTGLSSSIGYGKTLREATIAMRLAKAKKGDSIVGIAIRNSSKILQNDIIH